MGQKLPDRIYLARLCVIAAVSSKMAVPCADGQSWILVCGIAQDAAYKLGVSGATRT